MLTICAARWEDIPADSLAGVDAPIKSFIEGVEVTERDFLSRLARHGVKKLEPQGQKFDPNFRRLFSEIPDESVPTGTVAQVVESGYSIGERVLRPAKVGVTRGGLSPDYSNSAGRLTRHFALLSAHVHSSTLRSGSQKTRYSSQRERISPHLLRFDALSENERAFYLVRDSRRSVRLSRPPCPSRLEEPGISRSMP